MSASTDWIRARGCALAAGRFQNLFKRGATLFFVLKNRRRFPKKPGHVLVVVTGEIAF
jgi:hypothetical protein